MTLILDGRIASRKIKEWVISSVDFIRVSHGWVPQMVTVQVGENPAAERYIRNQLKASQEAGISTRLEKFDEDIPKEEFLKKLAAIGRDQEVDGIILQTPFPKGWPVDEILNSLTSGKDVEGVHPENLGRLYLGDTAIPLPCTAWAAISLLEWYGRRSFEQSRCSVIGRSPNVGKAVALMLMHRHGTVTVCHTRTSTEQLKEILAGSDIVIAAAGVAGIVDPKILPSHAWVIDVGTNVTEDGKLVGDVAKGAEGHVEALSPVPGGVGPITVSLLLANLLLCATRRRLGKSLLLPDLKKLREE
ncbi:MAG: bifunctional 5,10-methylenetetrahydrofolate dehydrogenase/5,10-methenyltetrahydrofolate cyclohydrolase [Synergistaceae bacterium]|nr:bifunctional 5,10-methylenetetrahydrofolate dehydrogenase/5,10-methenyltetrahydrofolate cyclohydrolase [Synergistaceae bacterium]